MVGAATQDALSARNDLLERLLAMQEQQAQQNTNSIVETEEVLALALVLLIQCAHQWSVRAAVLMSNYFWSDWVK